MKILGIDPGIDNCGLAVIESGLDDYYLIWWDTISPPKKVGIPEKLSFIYDKLSQVLHEHKPDVISIEKFSEKLAKAARELIYVEGIVFLLAGIYGIKVKSYSSRELKKFFTSFGSADKTSIINRFEALKNSEFFKNSDAITNTSNPDHHRIDALVAALFASFERTF